MFVDFIFHAIFFLQDLIESQQKASVLLEEYAQSRPTARHSQSHRLHVLAHCSQLSAQLSLPPSLDQARERIRLEQQQGNTSGREIERQGDREREREKGSDAKTEGFSCWMAGLAVNGLQTSVDNHLNTLRTMRDKHRHHSPTAAVLLFIAFVSFTFLLTLFLCFGLMRL